MKKADIKLIFQLYIYWLIFVYVVFLSIGHFEYMDIDNRTLLFLPIYVIVVAIFHFLYLKKNKKLFVWQVSKVLWQELWRAFGLTFFVVFSTLAALMRFDLLEMSTPDMFIIAGSVSILSGLMFYLGAKWKAFSFKN